MNIVSSQSNTNISGADIHQYGDGTIFRVLYHPDDKTVINRYVMKTSLSTRPLINLHDGYLWGDSLDSYTFEVVNCSVIINPAK